MLTVISVAVFCRTFRLTCMLLPLIKNVADSYLQLKSKVSLVKLQDTFET